MSLIKANDLQNASGGIPTVKGQRLIPTAWVNFDGTGTVSIRDSENVSSITDNGTGDWDVNYTNSMANANYSVVCENNHEGDRAYAETLLASDARIRCRNTGGGSSDRSLIIAIILGGQ